MTLIQQFISPLLLQNSYVVSDKKGSEAIIIDPGYKVIDLINSYIELMELHPIAVLITHGHLDHVYSIVPLCKYHNIGAYLSKYDQWMLDDPLTPLSSDLAMNFITVINSIPDLSLSNLNLVDKGVELDLLECGISIIPHPGHTPGSVIFKLTNEDIVFSGDSLLYKTVGRTDVHGSDYKTLLQSLKDVFCTMDSNTHIYTGHGISTLLNFELKHNIHLQRAINLNDK